MNIFFKPGDKVVRKGSTKPIMKVEGNTVKPDFPKYKTLEDTYTCSWDTPTGTERGEFHQDTLDLFELQH